MGRGRSKAGNIEPYGTEFYKVHEDGDVKFVKPNSKSVTAPMYTKTKGRVYATIDEDGDVKHISTYNGGWSESNGGYNRDMQIDLKGPDHYVDGKPLGLPHVHYGYKHGENGSGKPTAEQQELIDSIVKEWYKFKHKK